MPYRVYIFSISIVSYLNISAGVDTYFTCMTRIFLMGYGSYLVMGESARISVGNCKGAGN